MGEAYKGLTIRIGADTTPLSRAVTTANKALSSTQRELSLVNRGLKLDPESFSLLSARAQAAEGKLAATYEKLSRLNAGLKDLRGKVVGIEEMADNTNEAALKAELARESYNKIDKELEQLNTHYEKLAKEQDKAFDKKAGWDEIKQQLKELEGVTDDDIEAFRRLKSAHNACQEELETADAVVQYKKLSAEIEYTEQQIKMLARQLKEANSAIGFASKLKGQLSGARDALQTTENTAEGLEDELRRLNSALKLDPRNVDAAGSKMKNLMEQAQNTRERIKALEESLGTMRANGISTVGKSMRELADDAKKADVEYERSVNDVARLAQQLEVAERNANDLGRSVDKVHGNGALEKAEADVEQLRSKLQSAKVEMERYDEIAAKSKAAVTFREQETEVSELRGQLKSLNKEMMGSTKGIGDSMYAWQSLGMTLYASVSPAFQSMMSNAISSTDEIDSAYRDMRKTVRGAEEDFEHLKDAAIEFSKTSVVSAEDILEIEAMGGQLGISAENLEAFAETCSNLDIATNLSSEEIAEQLGQLSNVLDIDTDHMDNFGDALVRLGNNMPAQESNIMDVTSRIASMSKTIGMGTPEVLAWSTAIAATGQNSEAAGTAISNTMSDIETAVAKGGDSVQRFAEVSGMSAEEFANTWNANPSDAMQNFVLGLKKVQDSGGSVDKTLIDLGITGVRQKQALEGLTQTVDVLGDALTMSSDAWDGVGDDWGAAGDAAREAAQKSEGFSGSVAKMTNIASAFGYELGESVAPVLSTVADVMATAESMFSALPGPVKASALAILGVGTAAGVFLTGAVGVIAAISDVKKRLDESKSAWSMQTKAMREQVKASAKSAIAMREDAKATKKAADERRRAGKAAQEEAKGTYQATTAAERNSIAELKSAEATKQAEAAQKRMAVASKALKAVISGMAFSGLYVAFDHLSEAMSGAYEHEKRLSKALNGMKTASKAYTDGISKSKEKTDQLASSTDSAADFVMKFFDSLTHPAEAARSSFDDLLDEINSWYDTVSSRNGELANSQVLLQSYWDTINSLDGSSSSEDIAKVKTAIEGVNEACGSDFYVDEETKSIKSLGDHSEVTKEKVKALIDEEMRQLSLDAMKDTYKEAIQEQAKAADEAAKAAQNRASAERDLKAALDEGRISQEEFNQGIAPYIKAEQDAVAVSDSLSSSLSNTSYQMSLLEMASSGSATPIQSLIGNVSGLSTNCDAAGISMRDLTESLDAAGVSTTELGNVTSSEWADIVASYSNGQDGIASAMSSIANSVKDGSDEAVKSTEYMKASIALNLTNGDIEKASQLFGKDIIDGLKNGLDAGDPEAQAAMENLASDSLDSFKSYYGINSPSTVMIEQGGYIDEGLAKGIEGGEDGPTNAMTSVGQSMLAALTGQQPEFNKAGSNATSSYSTGAGRNKKEPQNSGKQVSGVLVEALNGAKGAAQKAGIGSSSSYSSGVASVSARGSGQKVANTAKDGLSSVSARTAGTHFVSGFVNGFGGVDVFGAAYKIGTSALGAIKKALGIASPSREAKKVGAFFVEGFTIGIDRNAADAIRSAKSVASKSLDAISIDGKDIAKQAAEASKVASRTASIGFETVQSYAVSANSRDYSGELAALGAEVKALSAAVSANSEVAVYVDGTKLASSIAKPMNTQLGKLANRSGIS